MRGTDQHNDTDVLVVIPARGGSRGIPRKNLRSLAGRPLIAYAIDTALACAARPYVVVSTDDDEIAVVAERCGAHVHLRDASLARDDATLDPVVYEAVTAVEDRLGRRFSTVVTMQPTSPLLRTASLDAIIERIQGDSGVDTILSVSEDAHLSWRRDGDRFVPTYSARRNRQFLEPVYRETGGLVATRREHVQPSSRFGPHVDLHVLELPESIDIDGHAEWGLCTHFLLRKRVLFVVTGHRAVGLGHVYHALLVANDLMHHDVTFLVDAQSQLAYDTIAARHYTVHMQKNGSIIDDIAALAPDVVVYDRLDSDVATMRAIKELGVGLVIIEDLGPGAAYGDAVINAVYPDPAAQPHPNAYYGHAYACLRDEFVLAAPRPPNETVQRVLVTFGGTDPSDLTRAVLSAIEPWCAAQGIAIDVVTGLGYERPEDLACFRNARVHTGVNAISALMRAADLAFTSAGRTAFELAALTTPSIVLAQNERELAHTFASAEHGFLHLGLGRRIGAEQILEALQRLVSDTALRHSMRERMLAVDVRQGRANVVRIVDKIVRRS